MRGMNGMPNSGQEWEAMMAKKVLVFSLLVSALFTVGASNASAEGESIDYSKVLQIYMPGAQWSLNGDGCCDQLTIHDGSAKPTKAQLDAMWASVEQEILAEMQAAYRAATGGSAEDDFAVEEGLVAAPVAASHSSFVVQSGAAQRSQLTETKALTVRGGLVYLNVLPTPSAGPSREMVLRATNGKKTFVWYLNSRAGEPRVIGSAKRFAGFRFTLRDGGRVTERIRFVR